MAAYDLEEQERIDALKDWWAKWGMWIYSAIELECIAGVLVFKTIFIVVGVIGIIIRIEKKFFTFISVRQHFSCEKIELAVVIDICYIAPHGRCRLVFKYRRSFIFECAIFLIDVN